MGITDHLDSLLSYCADAAVLNVQEGEWYFAHNKLRDGVLDQIPAPELKTLHRQIAQAIESTYQYSSRQTAASLAYHWGEAGDTAKEENYSAVAGDQALKRGAYQSAIAYLTRALELQSQVDTPKRKQVALKLQLGDVYMAMNDFPQALHTYQDALALGKQANYGWGVASSLNSIGTVVCEMGGEGADEYFMQALQTAMSIRATQVALAVMVGMASLLMREGDKRVAAEFIALALNHPAADSQTHYLGERLLTRLRDEVDPRELMQAIERGKEMSLREVTARILSE
jgi:predicted ATPase